MDSSEELELEAAKNVLLSHQDDLRRFLHFSTILPLLIRQGLLPLDKPGDVDKLLPPVDNVQQADNLVVSLTSSNNPQYLRQLIGCLRETAHELRAHEELADTLETTLEEELAKKVSLYKVTL